MKTPPKAIKHKVKSFKIMEDSQKSGWCIRFAQFFKEHRGLEAQALSFSPVIRMIYAASAI